MPTLLLLCMLVLLNCLATESAPGYLYHYCPNTTTFNRNSSYETNLNFTISSLSSNATRDTRFYNVTAGRTPPDVAYGLFLCRGDVTSQVCQDCVATAVNETVRQRCRGFKQAIIWYDECMLRYSNESFFSQVSESPRVAMYNTQNITKQNQFNKVLEDTLGAIKTQAVNDQSGKKFATKEENFTGFQRLYSLVQCTPDLSPDQCDQCLIGTIAILPDCCGDSQGARVLLPSCNVRYELYPFYQSVATPPAPPPAVPAPPSESSTKGKGGISSKTIVIIVVPTVVSVVIFSILCYCFICRSARKKYDTIVAENVNASIISTNINNVPVLNGSNFEKWKEHITILLGCMDLDYAIWTERPPALTDDSTTKQRANFEKWERSNRMSLMIMKHSIPDTIKGAMLEEENAKSFLSQIADRFAGSEKVETNIILSKLISMRYKGKGNIREYIMEMSNLVTRLRALKLELSDDILMHLVLISLPTQFGPFKISYNTQKEKWTLNELIAQCVQEEERLKQEKVESAHLATSSHDNAANRKRKRKRNNNNKGKGAANNRTSQAKVQQKHDKVIICFFCKNDGHVKKDCPKYAKWLVKKGLSKESNAN